MLKNSSILKNRNTHKPWYIFVFAKKLAKFPVYSTNIYWYVFSNINNITQNNNNILTTKFHIFSKVHIIPLSH